MRVAASRVRAAAASWGVSSIGGWGLAPLATTWLSTNYVNPYYTAVVQSQPAATAVYDYAQPINVAAAPPDPSAADTSEQVFSAARDSFKAGDYQRALDLAGNLEPFERFLAMGWNYFSAGEDDPVDKPSPLLDQLRWLEDAGFEKVDVFWMKAGHALFGGSKPI